MNLIRNDPDKSKFRFKSRCLWWEINRGQSIMGVCLAAWLFMHMPSSGGVRRETLRGVHKIQVGVWGGGGGGGSCEPCSRVRGRALEDFEITALQRLRTPVSLTLESHCCYTKIYDIFFTHCYSEYLGTEPTPSFLPSLIICHRLVSFGCVFSLTIDLLGRETPCKRHKLVLSLTVIFSSYMVIRTTSSWMKSCPWITRCDTKNIFLTSNGDGVEQSWKHGSFHCPFPVSDRCWATRKTVAPHSTLLVSQGEIKRVTSEALLLVLAAWRSRRVSLLKDWSGTSISNRNCAHRFALKWTALTAREPRLQSMTRFPGGGRATSTRAWSCALCDDQMLAGQLRIESWISLACDVTLPGSIAKTCCVLQCIEYACFWFWNKIWNFWGGGGGGSLATVNPLCVRACKVTVQ